MEQVRSFVAIELPEDLKEELFGLRERLMAGKYSGVRWVDPQSLHLTLKFLGNVPVGRIEDIMTALVESAREIPQFRLGVGRMGIFPNPDRARVAWVGLSGDTDVLKQLQRRVEVSLEKIGFTRESRPFTPHLTIARVWDNASPEERQRFGHLILDTGFEAQHGVNVEMIHLMRSHLTRQGAIYSRLGSVQLIMVQDEK